MGGGDIGREGLTKHVESIFELADRLSDLASVGHVVLMSKGKAPNQRLALPLEGDPTGVVVFAKSLGNYAVQGVTEGYVVIGRVRKRKTEECDATGIVLGDRVVLQDPTTQETITTEPMTWSTEPRQPGE